MLKISPVIKVVFVSLVCVSVIWIHYLLFNAADFIAELRQSEFLLISAVLYLFTIAFFAQYYYNRRNFTVLILWLFFNLALISNFTSYFFEIWPPLALQYSQSTSLFIYTVLLAFSKDCFPNWLRIFSLSCLLILIPCLIFYFSEMWLYYELAVYVLCLTPILKSFVFLKDYHKSRFEVLDD